VVGGGNTAITEALYLADICRTVHILVRTDRIRAEDIWVEKAKARDNIQIHYHTQVAQIQGDMMGVSTILCQDGTTIPAQGIFIAIGNLPYTELVDHLGIAKDEEGSLVVDARQETSVPGLYAAGDVTTGSNKFRQTIMSAAEGCLAAHSVHEDILRMG
jgi:thioredoxin reductase (NADPH)